MPQNNSLDRGTLSSEALLAAFRLHYHRFDQAIHEALGAPTDSVVLARLGDDIDEYLAIVNEVSPLHFLKSQE